MCSIRFKACEKAEGKYLGEIKNQNILELSQTETAVGQRETGWKSKTGMLMA